MSCEQRRCPSCNDLLIHQAARRGDESSSVFGQFIHDQFPNEFYWLDIDGVIYKRTTKILRVVEHKPASGRGLSSSQRTVLPILASMLGVSRSCRLLHPESGVFVVTTTAFEYGFDARRNREMVNCQEMEVRQIGGDFHETLRHDRLRSFCLGLPLAEHDEWEVGA